MEPKNLVNSSLERYPTLNPALQRGIHAGTVSETTSKIQSPKFLEPASLEPNGGVTGNWKRVTGKMLV